MHPSTILNEKHWMYCTECLTFNSLSVHRYQDNSHLGTVWQLQLSCNWHSLQCCSCCRPCRPSVGSGECLSPHLLMSRCQLKPLFFGCKGLSDPLYSSTFCKRIFSSIHYKHTSKITNDTQSGVVCSIGLLNTMLLKCCFHMVIEGFNST